MMRFLAKVAAQKGLSSLPAGARIYAALQDHFTQSTAVTPERVIQKVGVGLEYAHELSNIIGSDWAARGSHVEFGAGWHLTIPLLFWRCGCERQYLTDVRRCATRKRVFETANLVNESVPASLGLRRIPEPGDESLEDFLGRLGISYHAPVHDGLPIASGSAFLVTSTQTLLHPPRERVRAIVHEAARVLRPGGIFAAMVHLYDLNSDFDPALSRFNFLRYSDRVWGKWFSSDLMQYNRLRPQDYADIIEGTPFDPLVWRVAGPTAGDLQDLGRIEPDPSFERYSQDDLAASSLAFFLRRA